MDIVKTLDELDMLMERKSHDKVEAFLLSKIKEAESDNDKSSLLTILNELMGFYRSASRYMDCVSLSDYIISLMYEMGIEGTIPYATSILNVATAYREAGKIEESISNYNYVLKVYTNNLSKYDMRFASLYNNMSQAYIEINDYEKALDFLENALSIVMNNRGTEIEEAVTNSNMAVVLMKMNKLTDALKHIEKSLSIFESKEGAKDFHYAAALSAMGEYQYLSENYEKALDYFNRALEEIENNIGKNSHYDMICNKISLVYEKLKYLKQDV